MDVRPERIIAERVIRRLDREFAYHFRVEPYLWEREPLVASQSFQELIVPPRDTDIVMVILWSRLGVFLDEKKFPGPISGKAVTGTEWEFEDALASARERRLPDLLLYRKAEAAKGEFGDRAAVEERQHQTELVEEFMRRWTRDATGKAFTAASWTFADTTEFQQQVYEHLSSLLRKRLPGASDDAAPTIRWHKGSPYRGLESFEREHEQVFFGRTQARNEVRELLRKRVDQGTAFVLLTGASGSGKSSLAKAGLLPELSEAGMMGSVALVRWAVTHPAAFVGTPNADALTGLASAMLSAGALPELALAPLHYTSEGLGRQLAVSAAEAAQPVRQGLAAASAKAGVTERGEARLLLIVDQLEELFTSDAITPEMRERYAAALETLASSNLVWVIATMRSDFFDRLGGVPTLAHLASDGTYLLSPPEGAEIGEIIRQPAREAGLAFEVDLKTGRSLDDEIHKAASRDPGALPLLEYLLDQLWHQRSPSGQLTYAAYKDLHGLEGAIGSRAEEVLAAQEPEVQAAFGRVLRALVTGLKAGRATARSALRSEFRKGGPEERLIAAFEGPGARLVVADRNQVRVAHEALLNHWERARTQIEADARDLELRGRLETAAERLQVAKPKDRPSLLLKAGLPLIEARALLRRWGDELPAPIREFIRESRRAVLKARLWLLLGLAGAMAAVPLVAGLVWAGVVWTGVRDVEADMAFVDVPGGCFAMGSPGDEVGRLETDHPTRQACVEPFRLGKFEVTQSEWAKIVPEAPSPSRYKGESMPDDKRGRLPVETISWKEARRFTARMSFFGTHRYRMATEAEWEYAARAGTKTSRFWSDRIDEACKYANTGDASLKRDYGNTFGEVSPCDDGFAFTAPVGSFLPNAFGLHDMLGNVGEWVESCEGGTGAPGAPGTTGAADCKLRVSRGGSFFSPPENLRAAVRARFPEDRGYANVGLRVVLVVER